MQNTAAAARFTARDITTSALLAALLAASVLVTIPVGAVPLTFQTLILILIALTQRPVAAALTVGAYLAVGAVGLPVFSGMRGGIAVLAGPTGGYLVGFLVAAVVAAWVRELLAARLRSRIVVDSIAAAVVIVIVYTLGWAQLAVVTGMGALPALLAGVVPFLVPDALKAVGAIVLAPFVREASGTR